MMIGKFHVKRLFLAISIKRTLALIGSVVRNQGFEITEMTNLNAFVRRQTGSNLKREIILLQMHKPAISLGSALLDDMLPLILPLRILIREIGDERSVIYIPNWDVGRDAEATQAQQCMDKMYTEAVTEVTLALRESLGRAGVPDNAAKQSTQQKESTYVSSNSCNDSLIDKPRVGAAFRPRAGASAAQPVEASGGWYSSRSARRN